MVHFRRLNIKFQAVVQMKTEVIIKFEKTLITDGYSDVFLFDPISEINAWDDVQAQFRSASECIQAGRSIVDIAEHKTVIPIILHRLYKLIRTIRPVFKTVICEAVEGHFFG